MLGLKLIRVRKSAIFYQEAKIVFMDIRFACRHLCVCVVGYVTKWGICPSGLYLNYSISCPRRPDLIEVAPGQVTLHWARVEKGRFLTTSLKTLLFRPYTSPPGYWKVWACQYEFPAHSSDQKFVLESISVLLRRLGRSLMRVYWPQNRGCIWCTIGNSR